jgi:ribosomal protein S21
MPRGMDERFEDPSGKTNDDTTTAEATSEPADGDQRAGEEPTQATQKTPHEQDTTESSHTAPAENTDEPLNIREDWDSATIYVEPEQSEEIEVTFTRLKKQLKRDGYILEKNKHFYHAIFEIAFGEYREETKAKIRELVTQETNADSDSTNQ